MTKLTNAFAIHGSDIVDRIAKFRDVRAIRISQTLTARVTVHATLHVTFASVTQAGAVSPATSRTALACQTATTEVSATQRSIHRDVCPATKTGWVRRVRNRACTALRRLWTPETALANLVSKKLTNFIGLRAEILCFQP